MIFKVIDKCCNEYMEIFIGNEDLARLGKLGGMIQITPPKKGHCTIVHKDLTIEYIPNDDPRCNLLNIS